MFYLKLSGLTGHQLLHIEYIKIRKVCPADDFKKTYQANHRVN